MRSRHLMSNPTCPSRTLLTVTTEAATAHLHDERRWHPEWRSDHKVTTYGDHAPRRSEAKPYWVAPILPGGRIAATMRAGGSGCSPIAQLYAVESEAGLCD